MVCQSLTHPLNPLEILCQNIFPHLLAACLLVWFDSSQRQKEMQKRVKKGSAALETEDRLDLLWSRSRLLWAVGVREEKFSGMDGLAIMFFFVPVCHLFSSTDVLWCDEGWIQQQKFVSPPLPTLFSYVFLCSSMNITNPTLPVHRLCAVCIYEMWMTCLQ